MSGWRSYTSFELEMSLIQKKGKIDSNDGSQSINFQSSYKLFVQINSARNAGFTADFQPLIILYYWLNPIVISCYCIGQLDEMM